MDSCLSIMGCFIFFSHTWLDPRMAEGWTTTVTRNGQALVSGMVLYHTISYQCTIRSGLLIRYWSSPNTKFNYFHFLTFIGFYFLWKMVEVQIYYFWALFICFTFFWIIMVPSTVDSDMNQDPMHLLWCSAKYSWWVLWLAEPYQAS